MRDFCRHRYIFVTTIDIVASSKYRNVTVDESIILDCVCLYQDLGDIDKHSLTDT